MVAAFRVTLGAGPDRPHRMVGRSGRSGLVVSVVGTLIASVAWSGAVAPAGAISLSSHPLSASRSVVALDALGVDPATESRCDPIGGQCLLPFPNDYFTVANPSTNTGRRLAISSDSMPANVAGVHIDVTDQNRADGWSPGSTILAQIAGLDVRRSRIPTILDPSESLDANARIVVIDATTGTRLPFWAGLDAQADPGEQPLLMLHPSRNFRDGHRIVVGMRKLRDAQGRRIVATPAFAAYRDGQRTKDRAFEARRPAMERIFLDLRHASVKRGNLQLAWDFTVASTQSLTGRLLAIRDDAFGALGNAAPQFTVNTVTENPNEFFARRIEGTVSMPLYLTDGGAPGGRLVLDGRGVPQRQPGTFVAKYICNLPKTTLPGPARLALYGHGLLGDRSEVNGSLTKRMAVDHNIAYCATDWSGMAEEDIGNAAGILQDLSKFPSLSDRLQQGLLAFLYLGRVMVHPDGFSANAAFQVNGQPAIDRRNLYYDGNSQGAILGGALTAVAQDFTRSVLAEAGMNYSILLDRSVDFDDYLGVMRPSYPRRYDRVIGLEVAQLLWDRGETDGYANHITEHPLPHTPRHRVLLIGAVGDHQVSEFSLRVEAATLGVDAHVPVAARGRVVDRHPDAFLDPIRRYPFPGSSYWLWDTGSPPSPAPNLPPRTGHDPHDDTPNIPGVRELKSAFWQPHGSVTDVCNGGPCQAPIPPENAD